MTPRNPNSLRMPSGVVAVDKPEGPTSREMVDRVGRALQTRRVGHAGTLDPFAHGVVLVAWGRATRLVPYLQRQTKTYRATVRFGRETDTQDCTGTVVSELDASALTAEQIEAALPEFRGTISQLPPMFSAVKVDGQRLYKAARRGEAVERKPRERRVTRFTLLEWDPPIGRFEIRCSAGTYVRTLAHDLGQRLGSGASLDALERTAVGTFTRDVSVRADSLQPGDVETVLHAAFTPALALSDLPAITLDAEGLRTVVHGSWRDPGNQLNGHPEVRLLDGSGRMIALAVYENGAMQLRLMVTADELG